MPYGQMGKVVSGEGECVPRDAGISSETKPVVWGAVSFVPFPCSFFFKSSIFQLLQMRTNQYGGVVCFPLTLPLYT